jgi:hypothetical protein
MIDHRFTSPGARASAGATAAGAAVVLALALGACTDAPTAPAAPAASAALAATPVTLVGPAGQALLEDARSRLLPSLAEQALRGKLHDRLQALAAALDDGDEPSARRQLALTRKLVKASARRGDGADLASLTLALDEIEAQLDSPVVPSPLAPSVQPTQP